MQQVGVDSNHLRAQPRCPIYIDELTVVRPIRHVGKAAADIAFQAINPPI
jgi:hypothetical protein